MRVDRFTTADGASIAFTLHPAPQADAPRVVLIHSLALDRTIWDDVVDILRGEAELLTYDCRGHGQSDRRAGAFTAESFAHDLAQLMSHVNWPRAIVGGCSMGGCVALAFAGLFPTRASGLLLVDTTAWYGEDAAAKFSERSAAARTKGMRGLVDFQMTRWFSDGFRAHSPQKLNRAIDVFVGNDVDCYAASCALLGNVDVRHHLGALRVPVAIVVGEEDHATPVSMSKQLHQEIPRSTLSILPGVRHLTPIEQPDKIASELRTLSSRT